MHPGDGETVKTVMLALCSAAREGAAPAAAVSRAKALGAELLVAYVVDPRTIDELERRVRAQGFVGDRPCAELMSASVEESRRCAQTCIAEVAAAAKQAGVACQTHLLEGEWVDRISALVEGSDADGSTITECFAPDFAGSALRRLLRTDDLARLRARIGCPVVSVS